MWSIKTLGHWLLPLLELGHRDLLCGFYRAKLTLFNEIQWEQDNYTYHLMPFDNSVLFNWPMIVLTNSYLPYEQFDIDFILKVTKATYYVNLADLNFGTNLPQASIQANLGVLLFASVGPANIS